MSGTSKVRLNVLYCPKIPMGPANFPATSVISAKGVQYFLSVGSVLIVLPSVAMVRAPLGFRLATTKGSSPASTFTVGSDNPPRVMRAGAELVAHLPALVANLHAPGNTIMLISNLAHHDAMTR